MATCERLERPAAPGTDESSRNPATSGTVGLRQAGEFFVLARILDAPQIPAHPVLACTGGRGRQGESTNQKFLKDHTVC